jgi:hypothetical protein
MISYEEVETEKDLRNRKTAENERAKAAMLAEKEAKAKVDYARYNTTAVSTTTESFIDLPGLTNRSTEVVVILLNQGKYLAMQQAIVLFNLVLLAISHGQKDSERLAGESQKLARLLMNWPD